MITECVATLTDSSLASVTVLQQRVSLCLNPPAGCPSCVQVGVEDVTAVLSALIEAPVLPAGGAVLEVAGEERRPACPYPVLLSHTQSSCQQSLTQPSHTDTHMTPSPNSVIHILPSDSVTPPTPPLLTLSPHLTCCRHGR